MTGDLLNSSLPDYAWVKIKCSWWPAQVVDETTISKKFIPRKKPPVGALVRLYGTYHYLYADIVKCRSDFENVLRKNNCGAREEFQKTIDKLTSGIQKYGNLIEDPLQHEGETEKEGSKQTEKTNLSEKVGSPVQKLARKRKVAGEVSADPPKNGRQKADKLLNSEEHQTLNLAQAPETLRRIKVMQNLGLIAPCGSPFKNFVCSS